MEEIGQIKKRRKRWWLMVPLLAMILAAAIFSFSHGRWGANERNHFLPNAQQFNGSQQMPPQNAVQSPQQGKPGKTGTFNGRSGRGGEHRQQMNGRQASMHFGHGPMGRGFRGPHHFAFGLVNWILAGAVFLLGWLLRKTAGSSIVRKWTGWLLMFVGAVLILKEFLIAIAAAVFVYWLYKKWKKSEKGQSWDVPVSFQASPVPVNSHADLLDEWERSISKEEK
ncbi:hypothetical protein [Neobacillus terrae]|uniref:hypothetical protein n=1 Tax=Neobacillus terrae TaxID=3034837 RepID=UPI001407D019|nr:hypothetical protein [Neobacillus terrae]NHM31871.1 hypothetical protein [Neobacillus terrae]